MKHESFIHYNIVGIRFLYRLFPGKIILYCILQMLHGVSWVLQVVSMQYFFDMIADVQKSIFQLAAGVLLLGMAYAFAQIMNGVVNCYGQILNQKVGKETSKTIFRIIDQKEVTSFEYADELDQIHKASRGAEGVFWVSTTILDIIFFYVFYFAMMSWYLFSLAPVVSVSIVIIFVPNVVARLLHMISFERLENEAAPMQRKMQYYENCMIGKAYLKETRLQGCVSYFLNLYLSLLKRLNYLHFHIQLRKEVINFGISVLTVLAYGGVIGLLIYYVLEGTITAGAFVAVFASLREFYGFMDEVISERIAVAAENMAAVKNYFDFIKTIKNEQQDMELPEKADIRLENVSFSYPHPKEDARRMALSDINLQIPCGQTVALVGENGSGKSTLCHVIAGLYTPVKGSVSYGGIQKKGRRITKGISAVFQKFCCYYMTLGENVRISDITKPISKEKLHQLCKEVGVDPRWTGGLDGMLGKEFGGKELSGGEWQRIAIARGMFRDKHLLILDEPTAAIDALEEQYIYQKFKELSQNCTAIIVTHRLACAQIADRILVMKDGKIIQDGNHRELMAVEGEYRRMYDLQRQWYK